MIGIDELIKQAREHPARPLIEGLVNEGEIAGLHGPAEAFKTMFSLQLAESLATAQPFLDNWKIPSRHNVFFFETEMSVSALGTRLSQMYRGRSSPPSIRFTDETQWRAFAKAPNLDEKFTLLNAWIAEAQADVVILDTCNPFFRGKESPNDETTVGKFFDLLGGLSAKTKLFVRHNHKPRLEDSDTDAANKIRGSGQFGDVSDLLLELRRPDKRIHRANFAITKFRNGGKPDPLTLWFDAGEFRLIAVPPVIHLLQARSQTRTELLSALHTRFNVSARLGDEMIKEQGQFLIQQMEGHQRVLDIDPSAATSAEWFPRLPKPSRLAVQVMQGCISPSLCQGQNPEIGLIAAGLVS